MSASRSLDVIRGLERAINRFGTLTDVCFWEFPVVEEAQSYCITLANATGALQQRYQMHQSDVAATAVTTIPILTGDDPFPPVIPVHEELPGVGQASFYRRDSGIRYFLVWGHGFDPERYYVSNPLSVTVLF